MHLSDREHSNLIDTVVEDLDHGRRDVFDELTPHEQDYVLDILREVRDDGRSEKFRDLWEIDWKTRPVLPDEFFSSEYYLGPFAKDLYPRLKEELCYVLDPYNDIFEWVIHGSIGSGKTTCGVCAQVYSTYRLSCLRDPQGFHGLGSETEICFGFFSITLDKAESAGYHRYNNILNSSPYFQENFPHKRHRRAFRDDDDYIELPKKLKVLVGSRETHAVSENVFGAVFDEANEFKVKDDKVSKAQNMYAAIRFRVESRMVGYKPGVLCVISSSKTRSNFISRHVDRIKDTGARGTHVSRFSVWDTKRENRYSGETFMIAVGDNIHPTRILDDEAAVEETEQLVIEVPVEHRASFELDPERATRDLAGYPVGAINKFIPFTERIREAIDPSREHPFTKQIIPISTGDEIRIRDFLVEERLIKRYQSGKVAPLHYPGSARTAHADLALNGCAAGIAMGLPIVKDSIVYIFIDFVLRINPPDSSGDEIEIKKIRQFFLYLRDVLNFNLEIVSFDGFESADSRQQLKKQGFDARLVSMDRTNVPYTYLRTAIKEGRITYYDYDPLTTEVSNLAEDASTDKVMKAEGFSKDVADAVGAVVNNCMVNEELHETSASPPPVFAKEQEDDENWVVSSDKYPVKKQTRVPIPALEEIV